MSQTAAAFGSLPPNAWTDYGTFVGFWLNSPRARLSKLPTGRGAAFWDAVALDAKEGESLAADAALRELEASVRSRRKR